MKVTQRHKGSREAYARMEQKGGWRSTTIWRPLSAFVGNSCAKHIVPRYTDHQIVDLVGGMQTRIKELEVL
jgi:hypothetical protein